ncbi:diacylglycerol/lipid kinase family protein [Alkalibacterium sp. f15]|uniref:diacylglycerol/lipid kinase family protein n=1 Tax=Alkalibacterium sp. f15 TaxID=3414029 RepID=UPI003BF86E3F
MKNILILVNPSSGKKNSGDVAQIAEETFMARGWHCVTRITKQKSDIGKYTTEACAEKIDHLIIMGGDGTVSEALNALNGLSYRPIIGILPTGTANNIAIGWGMSTDIYKAIDQLVYANQEKCDVGEVNGHLFLSSLSSGTLPETVWEVSEEMKKAYGPMAYFLEGIKSLKDEKPYHFELTLDGKKFEKESTLLLIGVSHSVFGIPRFFSEANKNDGKLHLLSLDQTTLGDKMIILSKLIRNNEETGTMPSSVTIVSFEEATIDLIDDTAHVALDGEKGPDFPLNINVRSGYLTVLIPEKADKGFLFNKEA